MSRVREGAKPPQDTPLDRLHCQGPLTAPARAHPPEPPDGLRQLPGAAAARQVQVEGLSAKGPRGGRAGHGPARARSRPEPAARPRLNSAAAPPRTAAAQGRAAPREAALRGKEKLCQGRTRSTPGRPLGLAAPVRADPDPAPSAPAGATSLSRRGRRALPLQAQDGGARRGGRGAAPDRGPDPGPHPGPHPAPGAAALPGLARGAAGRAGAGPRRVRRLH